MPLLLLLLLMRVAAAPVNVPLAVDSPVALVYIGGLHD